MQASPWIQRASGGIRQHSRPLACHASASLKKIPANAGIVFVPTTRRRRPHVDPLWNTAEGTGHLHDRRREFESGRRGMKSCPIAYRYRLALILPQTEGRVVDHKIMCMHLWWLDPPRASSDTFPSVCFNFTPLPIETHACIRAPLSREFPPIQDGGSSPGLFRQGH